MSEVQNDLTIFLLKEECESFNETLEYDNLNEESLGEDIKFYYKGSEINSPYWLESFFKNQLQLTSPIQIASSNGILILRINTSDEERRFFAITFGHGRALLNKNVVEERFGLKTLLNIIHIDSIRKVNKKDISSDPKQSIEQRNRTKDKSEFSIDIEQEFILGLVGITKDEFEESFGRMVVGADYLKIKVKRDIDDIQDLLLECYTRYKATDYQENFGWIDYIAPLKNKETIERLDGILIRKINQRNNDVYLTVPEIIDWELLKGFAYNLPIEEYKDDLSLEDYLSTLPHSSMGRVSLKRLKQDKCFFIDINRMDKFSWRIYNCLYVEIELGGKAYILSNGLWFEVDTPFVESVNNFVNQFISNNDELSFSFIDCDKKKEAEYNQKFAESINGTLLDCRNVNYGDRYSKIEVCDILSNNMEFIHVKKYGGSSVLSHLFNQGVVSAELMREQNFVSKLKDANEGLNLPENITPSECFVVYGIITKKDGPLYLPLFSRISLKNAIKRLKSMDYKVCIKKIKDVS